MVPWIFRNEVGNVDELAGTGQPALLVNVENDEGRELGSAVVNLQKGVNVYARMLAGNANIPIDAQFFADRIKKALDHRQRVRPGCRNHRLLNGEGDLVPGVLVDRYGDDLVIQFSSAAMEFLCEGLVVDALQETLSPRAIIRRYDNRRDRKLEGAPLRAPELVRGRCEAPAEFSEALEDGGTFTFCADLLAGGWQSGRVFEDRLLRGLLVREVSRLTSGGAVAPEAVRVLGLFSQNLGVLCASRGASVVCGVQEADDDAQKHLQALADRNGCAANVSICGLLEPRADALGDGAKESFDIVTLEPPPLASSFGHLKEGEERYVAWVAAAVACVRPGGLLLVSCRSRTISIVRFLRFVNLGIWSGGRRATVVHRTGSAPSDFPVLAALPDTGQMQTMVLRVH